MVGKSSVFCYNWIMAQELKSWNRGFTKETHLSVLKISETFKRKRLDNFKEWRDRMKKLGKIRSNYPALKKNGDLAELIGVVLGDGHIEKFPRTEGLSIFSNSNNVGFIERYAGLMGKLFDAKPYQGRHGISANCIRIRIYQKAISRRLGVPIGARKNLSIKVPAWIKESREYLKRYLRGLYEAEGSLCVHKPTCTYKFFFSNRNESLLSNVFEALKILGFHPHKSKYKIQISKKDEVYKIKDLIRFRKY